MGNAKMGALKRAAEQLGVTSTVLGEQGWRSASPARIRAVQEDLPDWLIVARERRMKKVAARQRRRDRKRTAARLGVQERTVKEHDISPAQVADLLGARPDWLLAEQNRRRRQIAREDEDTLRRGLAQALVTSVEEAWLQELKRAASDDEADAIDSRWAIEIQRAKREARELVDQLTPERVRARIVREEAAQDAGAVYRASQILQRALEGEERGGG